MKVEDLQSVKDCNLLPFFKLEPFDGTAPNLFHWFQRAPEFSSGCNCSLLLLLLVMKPAFAIKLLSHSQPLLSSDPLFMNHCSHGIFHAAHFFTCISRPFCFLLL